MYRYGEVIDSGVDLQKVNVYNFFVNYFNNPRMSKIKTIDGYVMYGCKINSLLSRDKRYIIVLVSVKNDFNKSDVHLDDINWDFLQTRCLDETYAVPQHSYNKLDNNYTISVYKKTDTKYLYSVNEFPNITVSLLFGKNQARIYNDKGTLNLAIENYNTIVSFNQQV